MFVTATLFQSSLEKRNQKQTLLCLGRWETLHSHTPKRAGNMDSGSCSNYVFGLICFQSEKVKTRHTHGLTADLLRLPVLLLAVVAVGARRCG